MRRLNIAVVGSGVSGLSAAWLLSKRHRVTLFEANHRFGGHSHTHDIETAGGKVPVDVGFIVYNETTYPNLVGMLDTLGVDSQKTEMGFSVSLQNGEVEYSGQSLFHLMGTWPACATNPTHWNMVKELVRFYRQAKQQAASVDACMPLGQFLKEFGYSARFVEFHLLPMAAAIWSSETGDMMNYPAKAFIQFFDNHQLLTLGRRKPWRTVKGGSRNYVAKLLAQTTITQAGLGAFKIKRSNYYADVVMDNGAEERFDHVVLACHADEALRLLDQPSEKEIALLSPFRYSDNRVVLHQDAALMPRAKRFWSSWNYVSQTGNDGAGVTYWMNALQHLPTRENVFVSLNPQAKPHGPIHLDHRVQHPVFTDETFLAQQELWSLQGQQNTWFCGAYFGAGFHEDGLQSGLAVAEDLGGLARPWNVANGDGRIVRKPVPQLNPIEWAEAAE
ncbi:NAD(P)/FAD-dependent oxidoreductase [Aestuariivirga litoralis]|uniref:NAD(P)/FAD-dependent oxidoreductase n=1 Tax=Aestuariivirga litoralis TaxID=2650924 RepID=UPI0018C597EA|nr:FAD-dependent oxidoreductase [Aestuariivirga litoralis]MBG1231406.1 FAD-dependent oxidoreductase [Aestuariivirga litoralis]